MKQLFLFLICIPYFAQGQLQLNIDLLDHWTDESLVSSSSKVRFNDCWGYFDSIQRKEYAIIGSTEGHHFFEVDSDNKLIELDFLKGKYTGFDVHHRDIKTYQHYAYMVCDEGNSSLQIADLNYLPDSVHLVYEDTLNFTRVHNIFIDSSSALLYACDVLGNSQDFSLRVYSLTNPESPQLIYTEPGNIQEVHDCFVRNGIAYLNCGFEGLRVYDFQSPNNPVFIQNLDIYHQQGYNHQGWMTPDGTRFFFGDETNGKKIKNCVVSTNHELTVKNYFETNSVNGSVSHNIMADNDFAFVAYYNEGLRVFDIRSHIPKEIAHYDTYPEEHPFKMFGAWGVYSNLPSQRILVSDRQNGLFLLDFDRATLKKNSAEVLNVHPNPSNGNFTVLLNDLYVTNFTLKVFDINGRVVYQNETINQTYLKVNTPMQKGVYFVKTEYFNYLGEKITQTKKIVVN